MTGQSRHPRVGDMIIRKISHDDAYRKWVGHDREYIGLVCDIRRDEYGHQSNVLIAWTEDTPPDYKDNIGYCGVNIHNIRSEFDVIRDGVNIP